MADLVFDIDQAVALGKQLFESDNTILAGADKRVAECARDMRERLRAQTEQKLHEDQVSAVLSGAAVSL